MKKKRQIGKQEPYSDGDKSVINENLLPNVEIKDIILEQGTSNEFTSRANKVIFVIRGQVDCMQEGYSTQSIQARNMFFVRIGMQCRITAQKESLLVFLRHGNSVNQKDNAAQAYTSGMMANKVNHDLLLLPSGYLPVLPFNSFIHNFTVGLLSGIHYIAEDEFYANIKVREFFFLVGISYSENDRSRFFESLDSAEQSFAAFIYRNYKHASSVKELAFMTCYSLSGFEKRFRKIFGQPASQWIARRKAQNIYTEICDTSKPFKQLSHEYGFSCPAHFTRFCHKHFGKSPVAIRQSKVENNETRQSKVDS